MATKTENLKKALILEGFVLNINHRSNDPCYEKEVVLVNKETGIKRNAIKSVFVLTGTLRYCYNGKRTDAMNGERFAAYLLKQYGLEKA